jgi:hypothetical protein
MGVPPGFIAVFPTHETLAHPRSRAPLDPLRRHGSFGHWIRVAAGLHGREVRHVDVIGGEALPADAGAYPAC